MILLNDIADYIESHIDVYPKICYQTFERQCFGNIDYMKIYRYNTKITLNKSFLNTINYSIHADDRDILMVEYDDETYKSEYSFNSYYIDKQIFNFDKMVIDSIINDNISITVNLIVFYKEDCYYPFENITLPKIATKPFIVNNIGNVYGYFENDKMVILDNHILSFTNLSNEYFKDIYKSYYQYNYLINEDKWCCAGKHIGDMEKLISIFSREGFKYPLCLYQDKDKFIPIACNCRLLSSEYLNLPSIPVCIIASSEKIDYNSKMLLI